MRARRRLRRALAGLVGIAMALCACDRPVPRERIAQRLAALQPANAVLIVVDTLRADWTSPYGGGARVSPELQRWADRGVVFETVFAQSSWTKTSMASLMTSLWPQQHGVRGTRDGLGEAALTLAETFSDAGYQTFAVQSNGWLEQTFGFQQGFDRYMFPRGGVLAGMKPMVWPHADNVYLEAERLLEHRDPARPFFLYLHFMDVHEYASPSDVGGFGSGDAGAYRAAIAWVDEVVERLRRKLDASGASHRTLMLLASDHGEAFGENGTSGHARNLSATALRVPLVVRLPFAIDPIRVAEPARNIDIAPTLLALAGLPIPEGFQGRSLLTTMLRPAEREPELPAFASLGARLYADATLQEAVREGRWALIRDTDERATERLFDRRVDPDENVDLIDLEPAAAGRLRALLDTHLSQRPRAGSVARDVRIRPELAERLRALGYGT